MFSTHSAVSQLKPDTVVQCVQSSEEAQYGQGDVLGSSAAFSGSASAMASQSGGVSSSARGTPAEGGDLGTILLGCGSCVLDIHAYFSLLESRKCRVNLGVRRTQNSIRPVAKLVPPDDGSSKTGRQPIEVLYLDNRELRVFRHAYLCAVYPVLAAPGPPSPVSPTPESASGASKHSSHPAASISASHPASAPGTKGMHGGLRYTQYAGATADVFVRSISPSSPEQSDAAKAMHRKTMSPYTFHDSGVEESDEAGLIGIIPMESICQLLQRAFGLSSTLFRQYESVIVRAYSKAKKSPQKLLAEELTGQLAVLENNSHPFYAPAHFITPNGYDLWQKQERVHIAELLDKFWQHSLPYPRDHQERIADLQAVHEDYHILLKKLLDYESQFREEADGTNAMTFTPLSSASCRLLLEFGLRYGIGEMFRKTLLLQNLISEFSSTVGYLTYVNNLVLSIRSMLPSNKAVVVMVKQELDVLHSSLRELKTQTCKALSQMKDLFSDSRPANGISLLLSLLKSVMGLMAYLVPSSTESYRRCVHDTVLGIFRPHYEKLKAAVRADCSQERDEVISSQMVNIMIGDIQSEVADFRNNFEGIFQKFFSITKMAAISFYQLLVQDVDAFCHYSLLSLLNNRVEIDRQTLALAYRLNQLDSEWAAFISPKHQTWRVSFLPKIDVWTGALKLIAQGFILKAVSADQYMSQKIELPQPLLNYQDPSQASDRNSCSISVVSITPSVNSAFSSIMSSIRSTPCHAPASAAEQPTNVNRATKQQGVSVKKRANSNVSPSAGISTDQATGSFLQENEPVTFISSSFDNKFLKTSMSLEDHDSRISSLSCVSLPDKLNRVHVSSSSNSQGGFNRIAAISAWREEVAKHHQPQMLKRQQHESQVGPLEKEGQDRIRHGNLASGNLENAGKNSDHRTDSEQSRPTFNVPSHCFSPASSDEEEAKGSGSTVDHVAFSFPPLRVDSEPNTTVSETVDFSEPVFQRSQSHQMCTSQTTYPRHKTHLSALGTRSPAILLDRQNLNMLSSLGVGNSDSTITLADTREAILSTSGSLTDIVVLLQRLCGFSTNLLGIFLSNEAPLPEKSNSGFVSKPKFSESTSESGDLGTKSHRPLGKTDAASGSALDSKSFASSGSDSSSFQVFKSWSSFSTTFSSNPQSSKDEIGFFRTISLQPSEEETKKGNKNYGDPDHTVLRRDPRQAVVRTPSRIGPLHRKSFPEDQDNLESSELFTAPTVHFSNFRTRLRLHLQVLGALCNILVVYSTNVLCMDLCGTPKAVAKKLIGANLVNFVRNQQASGVVWGCRHQAEVPYSCLYYFNRRVDFLCERYEPVTQNMCVRVNNAFACLHILNEYYDKLARVFGLEKEPQEDEFAAGDEEAKNASENNETSGRSDGGASGTSYSGAHSLNGVISSSSGYLTSEAGVGKERGGRRAEDYAHPPQQLPAGAGISEDSYVSSEDDALSDSAHSAPSTLKQRWRTQAQRDLAKARHHILATVTSMCRLLAYKLNLFVRDGVPMLLCLRDPCVSMDSCLLPITTFMQRYLDSLSSWLYQECFKRVLDYLWVLIVQDIEFHANRLFKAESSATSQAHDWMLAISVFIKFMNNNGRGIKKELLLSQANDVIFRLQLFTLSTQRLIIVFQKLKDYHLELIQMDDLTVEDNASRSPPAIIHRIHGELQSLRKCFSGAELVHWIVKNRNDLPADLPVTDEEITKEVAIKIAQELMDNQFIMELDSVFRTQSNTPTSLVDAFSPYPQLSVHSHVVSEAEDESWDVSDGHPPGQYHNRPHLRSDGFAASSSSRSASEAGKSSDAVFEAHAQIHHGFPPLSTRLGSDSTTPSNTPSTPGPGQGDVHSPSPLGLGGRYDTSPSASGLSSSTAKSPGPMDHSGRSDRSSAETQVKSNQSTSFARISQSRSSPSRTPTPSGNHDKEGHNIPQEKLGGLMPQQSSRQGDWDIPAQTNVTHSSKSGGGQNQHSMHTVDADFLGSLGSRASIADFRPSAARPQPHGHRSAYGKLRRRNSDSITSDSSDVISGAELGNGMSPFSSIAELDYLTSRKFEASSKKFYFIHQSVLNPSLSFFRLRQPNEVQGLNHRHSSHYHRQHNVHYQVQEQPRSQHHHRRNYQFESRALRNDTFGRLSAPILSASSMARREIKTSAGISTAPSAPQNSVADQEDGENAGNDKILWHQKNTLENLALVEQCVSHKITPDHIAAVIFGRRKTDNVAKKFYKLHGSG